MKTCGDCPWYDGDNWCNMQHEERSDESPECRIRKAFRVIRDACEAYKDTIESLRAELKRVKAEVPCFECRALIGRELGGMTCETCQGTGKKYPEE